MNSEARQLMLETVASLDDLERLRADWEALLVLTPQASAFQTWEWQYYWWKHYGSTQRLRVLVLREGSRALGILPLYVQRQGWGPLRVDVARLLGTGRDTEPDYLGALFDPAQEARVAQAFAAHVLDDDREWQVLELSDLPPDSVLAAAIAKRAVEAGLVVAGGESARIAYARLPLGWDEYLGELHRDRRYTLRSTRRKLEGRQGRFSVIAAEAEVDSALDRLIALHLRRFQGRVARHAFSSAEFTGFHRDVVRACAQRDRIRFYSLDIDGVPAAMFFCYRFNNCIYYFQAGFDPAQERLRPGLVLMGYAFEHAMAEGNTVFDFLRGEHEYKTQWGKDVRATHYVRVYRAGIGAWAYRWRRQYWPRCRRTLGRWLRRKSGGGHA